MRIYEGASYIFADSSGQGGEQVKPEFKIKINKIKIQNREHHKIF